MPAVPQHICTARRHTTKMNTVKGKSTWLLIQPVTVIHAFNCDCLQKAVGPLHLQFKATVDSWCLLWCNRYFGQNHIIIQYKLSTVSFCSTVTFHSLEKIAIMLNDRTQEDLQYGEALRYKPKVVGSILDSVIGIFHWHYLYCCAHVFLLYVYVWLPWLSFFSRSFFSCKANARVKPAKTGHGPHSS